MATDWLLRVGTGKNLFNGTRFQIWGIQSQTCDGKYFVENVKRGDRLWFIQGKSQGKILAVATYCSHNKRELGPLISMTVTNEELGWDNEDTDWTSDTEIHYSDFYNVSDCEGLLTHIKSPKTVRKYNEKCLVNLAQEYPFICRYRKSMV
jgi:hypothetical protein